MLLGVVADQRGKNAGGWVLAFVAEIARHAIATIKSALKPFVLTEKTAEGAKKHQNILSFLVYSSMLDQTSTRTCRNRPLLPCGIGPRATRQRPGVSILGGDAGMCAARRACAVPVAGL